MKKFATSMTQEEYQAPTEQSQPSIPPEKPGTILEMVGHIIDVDESEGGKSIAVTAVGPDPEIKAMVKSAVHYPLSQKGRFKLSELETLQGSKIEMIKEGNQSYLSVDDKKLSGMEVRMVWQTTIAGDNAPNPGILYWKLISLRLPKAEAKAG